MKRPAKVRTKRLGMVGWYNPPRLVATGIRVAISTVFGEFVDRREAMAAANEIDPDALDPAYDYSKETGDFWIDFVADTGDGWNPTYAVARLLADPMLKVKDPEGETKQPLPRGRILIFGGDLVYPTASRSEYAKRFSAPFDEAAKDVPAPFADMYALPGNHDWYDGLISFLALFCRRRGRVDMAAAKEGRVMGGRQTKQTRSYFALQLPNGWWLWGVDIQLKGYVDQPQVDFFDYVARKWMKDGSGLILCTGQPSWEYTESGSPNPEFKNFSYLESLATLARRNHHLALVVSGDSHHYAHYVEGSAGAEVHYLTAGGGGAFLHPTHHLGDRTFDWDYPAPNAASAALDTAGAPPDTYTRSFVLARDGNGEARVFPSQGTSKWLAFRNLGFAILNWEYAATLAVACFVFAWLLDTNARIEGASLASIIHGSTSVLSAVCAYLRLVFASPWPLALAGVAAGGYYYLSDFKRRVLTGGLHALAQFASVIAMTIAAAWWLPGGDTRWGLLVYVGALGGIVSATAIGIYFLVSLNVFGRHSNEAFSALRIQNYKNFLRLCITADGDLRVHPIGLKSVPKDDAQNGPNNPDLCPRLIEPAFSCGRAPPANRIATS